MSIVNGTSGREPLIYSSICLIRHHSIRYFFVNLGRIPIFCVPFCLSNLSISSIRQLFLAL